MILCYCLGYLWNNYFYIFETNNLCSLICDHSRLGFVNFVDLSKKETLTLLIVSVIYYFFHVCSYLDYVLSYTNFSHNLHFYLQFLSFFLFFNRRIRYTGWWFLGREISFSGLSSCCGEDLWMGENFYCPFPVQTRYNGHISCLAPPCPPSVDSASWFREMAR